ncbi:MAG: DUF4294 domain-containing protein [Ferruginibacter sp.]
MFFRTLHMAIKKLVIITGIFLFTQFRSHAQTAQYDTITQQAIVYNGDTIELKTLGPVYFYSHLTKAQQDQKQAYNRLRNAVYVTYPYARRAGAVMNDINAKLLGIPDGSARRKYIHSREKELRKEFTKPLTDLSIYQGKILMKLINRETGNNCYEIIKEYQGGVTARLYQTVAFFFDSNLKQAYDPRRDDLVIERLVLEVQRLYGYTDIKKS